ncbi:PTS system mannose/fructose/sorbose family transporter subunit IID [Oceanivirga salmonicida]|uniref:PTS system mannose/fructose/sorbose family transporter subunit IID n=1 Tax=Oceanivirga salmonicida TaxID=1769291 RepID=UPI000B1CD443|nr:PTS system mannose/fructose/sorbose family transporter subunit IID [Oceanivirga salmonicida]
MIINNKNLSVEDKKMLNKIFLNSFLLEASYNYEGQQGLGYLLGIMPAINRFYKTEKERKEAYKRHLEIFNTTPQIATLIFGVTAALEKEASENKEFDKSSINSVKIGLMGPFAGIGDSFFWGTLRIIATGIGLSLAAQGTILGPILFLLIFNIPHILIRYFGTFIGYKFGQNIVTNAKGNNVLSKISKSANIVGLMVIGGMTSLMVKLSTIFSISLGDKTFEIQSYIDQIFPLLLPLLYTLFMVKLLKNNYKASTILFFTIAFGIIGAYLNIF